MTAGKFRRRCHWVNEDPLYLAYHDEEWGVPLTDDNRLFELLLLEGAQAGLSWYTVLKKRENYRRAFDNFDPQRIARYDGRKRRSLLNDPGIIRNRLKIEAATINARAFIRILEQCGSFSDFLWKHVAGKPRNNRWKRPGDVPASTPESDRMSRELKGRGFKFVGTTICYAFMQASGMVNDHLTVCYRHKEVARMDPAAGTD
jgi:DNA-3-methyladenine glycosylase I